MATKNNSGDQNPPVPAKKAPARKAPAKKAPPKGGGGSGGGGGRRRKDPTPPPTPELTVTSVGNYAVVTKADAPALSVEQQTEFDAFVAKLEGMGILSLTEKPGHG